jgi:Zn ribbon nucleic-acid-binding protein
MSEMKIISNCPLCGERSLHILGEGSNQVQQCINCGHSSGFKFNLNGGKKEDNEEYKKLTDDMKNWTRVADGRFWIPTIFTLPFGMLYPDPKDEKEGGELTWRYAEMVEISEKEKEKFPNHTHQYDLKNSIHFDSFLLGLNHVNEMAKKLNENSDGLKLDGEKVIEDGETKT